MLAASAMSAVMLADQRKFARGYIIRSSLRNESLVTLHACGRDSCGGFPMWAPGARREWAPELRRAPQPKKAPCWPFLRSATLAALRRGHGSLWAALGGVALQAVGGGHSSRGDACVCQ